MIIAFDKWSQRYYFNLSSKVNISTVVLTIVSRNRYLLRR